MKQNDKDKKNKVWTMAALLVFGPRLAKVVWRRLRQHSRDHGNYLGKLIGAEVGRLLLLVVMICGSYFLVDILASYFAEKRHPEVAGFAIVAVLACPFVIYLLAWWMARKIAGRLAAVLQLNCLRVRDAYPETPSTLVAAECCIAVRICLSGLRWSVPLFVCMALLGLSIGIMFVWAVSGWIDLALFLIYRTNLSEIIGDYQDDQAAVLEDPAAIFVEYERKIAGVTSC